MSLTLLKRFGKYGILGNESGATFLYSSAAEDDWAVFKTAKVKRGLPVMRRLEAIGPAIGGVVDATWTSVEMGVVAHGSFNVTCYFDVSPTRPDEPKWYVHAPPDDAVQ